MLELERRRGDEAPTLTEYLQKHTNGTTAAPAAAAAEAETPAAADDAAEGQEPT